MVENGYKCFNCYFRAIMIQLYSSLISKRIIGKIKNEENPDKTNCKLASSLKSYFLWNVATLKWT